MRLALLAACAAVLPTRAIAAPRGRPWPRPAAPLPARAAGAVIDLAPEAPVAACAPANDVDTDVAASGAGPAPAVLVYDVLPDAPGAPGSFWRDGKGRVLRVPSCPDCRRALNVHDAVLRFGAWLRDMDLVGWHAADDVVGFYQWFCAEDGLEEMNHDLLLERFARAPGVARERRRLNDTTDKGLLRIKRRLGCDRAQLYRVASHEELAEQAEAEAAAEAAAAADAEAAKAEAGKTRPRAPRRQQRPAPPGRDAHRGVKRGFPRVA